MSYEDLKERVKRIKEETPLEKYFERISKGGILEYDKQFGSELYYKKPDQRTGSISVNLKTQLWYDHQNEKGGDIFNAVDYFEGINNFKDKINHLENNKIGISNLVIDSKIDKGRKSTNSIITKVNETIKKKALISYLKNDRGLNVNDVKGIYKEVHYKNEKGTFYALGIQDPKLKGWSMRSSIFKGKIGKMKPIWFKVGNDVNPNKVKVFEGGMDFVSYRKMNTKHDNYWACVSNNLPSKDLVKSILEKGKNVELYMDNSFYGQKKTIDLINEFGDKGKIVSKSHEYSKFEDLNDQLTNKIMDKVKLDKLNEKIESYKFDINNSTEKKNDNTVNNSSSFEMEY